MNDVGGAQGAAERGRPSEALRVPGLVLLRRLGAGAHGEVWLAADIVAGDRVAVKVRRWPPGAAEGTHPEAGIDRDAGGSRPSREIALLRRIDDPHVVRLRRVVDLPTGGRALVMDLAAGGSLAEIVAARGPLSPAQVCTTIVPIARTLAELHRQGLVHGGLSPANILFSGNGRPMIADLGCAAVLGGRLDAARGADGYGDPMRIGPATPQDDVYALGALIRFALTGDPGGSSSGRARADALADGLLALAELCTKTDPARRPAPDVVARTIHSTTPSAPVRLVRTAPDDGQAPGGAGPGSAAARGWTRPAVVDSVRADSAPADSVPTAVIPPLTSIDLLVADAVKGTAPRVTAATAVTRRTPSARRNLTSGGSVARGSRDGVRGRRAARSTQAASKRQRAWRHVGVAVVVLLAVVGGARLTLGGDGEASAGGVVDRPPARSGAGPHGPTQASEPSEVASGGRSEGTAGSPPPGVVHEPVAVAVSRLAQGRAAAFTAVSARPLADVDEPGSPAMVADTALVTRLRDLGLRLDGLRFAVGEVRQLPGDASQVLVETTVTTSSHRQVAAGNGAVRAMISASTRRVVLTLVPSSDGRRWLVHSADGQEQP